MKNIEKETVQWLEADRTDSIGNEETPETSGAWHRGPRFHGTSGIALSSVPAKNILVIYLSGFWICICMNDNDRRIGNSGRMKKDFTAHSATPYLVFQPRIFRHVILSYSLCRTCHAYHVHREHISYLSYLVFLVLLVFRVIFVLSYFF